MELIKIKGVFKMDSGAPMPLVISNDDSLFVIFNNDVDPAVDLEDESKTVLKFNHYMKYKFGLPSDETLSGHPYYSLGLKPYSFFELKGSDFIVELMEVDSTHPNYTSSRWDSFRHFIITFHDNTFECVAKDFNATTITHDIRHQAIYAISSLF
jgi:hypothetical protein